MGENAGRLDVLTRQTPRVPAGASAAELSWDQMWHRASVLANSGMVRKAYDGKPEAIMYAGAKGAELGWSLVASLDFIDPIEGRAEVNAQGRLALIRQAGHEAEVVDDQCDDKRAVVRGRRRGSQDWHYVEWTIEEAETAGLRAEWVEKWNETQSGKRYAEKVFLKREGDRYVPAKFGQTVLPDWAKKAITEGKVKCNEGWWNYPGDKLVARAASRLCRRHFSEVLIGRGLSLHTADEQGYETASDLDETAAEGVIVARVVDEVQDNDDIADAELVDQGEATAAPPGLAPDDEQDEVYARRCRRANAVMGEVGVKRDDDRHRLVHTATGGATSSTGRLASWQVEAIVDFCTRLKTDDPDTELVGQDAGPETAEAPPGPAVDGAEQTAAPAGDRDNVAGAQFVGAPATAPGPVRGEWRARAVELGKSEALVLRMAQGIATELGLTVPSSLDQVTEPKLVARLEEWLG